MNFLDQVESDSLRAVYADAYSLASSVLSEVLRHAIDGFDHCASNQEKVDKRATRTLLSLARHSISKFDSICFLLAVGAVESCHPLLRSMFESTLSIRYIAVEQSVERALAYRFVYLKSMIQKYEQWTPTHSNYPDLQAAIVSDLYRPDLLQSYTLDAPALVANYEAYLASQSDFAPVAAEWNRLTDGKGGKKRKKIEWYSLFSGDKSINSMADLATAVRLRAEYESLWRFWTGSTHSLDTAARLHDTPTTLRPLRSPDGFTSAMATGVAMFTCGIESLTNLFDLDYGKEWKALFDEKLSPKIGRILNIMKEVFN